MHKIVQASQPFIFYTRLSLSELTGLKALNLEQLLNIIKSAPDSCIYYHTHNFMLQHQYLVPEPSNDFAYWVGKILGEKILGEELSSIDTVKYANIDSLRRKITATINAFLRDNPFAYFNFVRPKEEFHFIKSVSYVIPTVWQANNLIEFIEAINKVTLDSIYFHIFESRLRLEKRTNDFSCWIETSLGDKELADDISELNPYRYTLEELRKLIVNIIKVRLFN